MAKRLSNKQRIERMAEEASIEAEDKEQGAEEKEQDAEEKAPKPRVRKASGSKKAAPKPKRMKLIWTVVDANFKEIASFLYPAKAEADARASELSEKTGKPHKVISVKVPMGDDE
ncbi:MAG: hypothetical protein ABFE01_23335 [Phycisphaerales bacterium]